MISMLQKLHRTIGVYSILQEEVCLSANHLFIETLGV